jgi:beta-N-acetylhexosaminidase
MNTTAPHPGQFVMVDMEGTSLSADTAQFLRDHHVRAVCLFRHNLGTRQEVQKLTADLRSVLGPQGLIGIDQEGGAVIRATFLPQAPAAMALGAANDPDMAYAVGAAVARGLRSLGINWNFAPVLDVNNNPANPVIAERSFSADPHAVVRLAEAWMQGSMSEGVACCVKHFPGHGDTHTDSHHALPSVDKSIAQLEILELIPFRALAGTAPAVMTAHIVYPQIDAELPATLSHKILTGILREALDFQGVIITDALMMKAVYDRFGHARSSVLALQAGADLVLAQGARQEQLAALHAIDAAMKDDRLHLPTLVGACARIDALATQFPLVHSSYSDTQEAQDQQLMLRAWTRGLTSVGAASAPSPGAAIRVIAQAEVASDGVSEAGLPFTQVQALFAGFSDVEFMPVKDLSALQAASIARDSRCNILVSNLHARYPNTVGDWPIDLHLAVWNPFHVFDIAAPAVVTWGYADGAMGALRAWLTGQVATAGVAPVPLATA